MKNLIFILFISVLIIGCKKEELKKDCGVIVEIGSNYIKLKDKKTGYIKEYAIKDPSLYIGDYYCVEP